MVTSRYLTLNRLFNDIWSDFGASDNGTVTWTPQIDVVEENGEIRISAELPGVKPEDLKVSVESNVLSLEGQKARGAFRRAFTLPATVDAEGIKAKYEHGVLTVFLPKLEKAKARQIAVESVN